MNKVNKVGQGQSGCSPLLHRSDLWILETNYKGMMFHYEDGSIPIISRHFYSFQEVMKGSSY